MDALVQDLHQKGVTTVPVLTSHEVKIFREAFDQAQQSFPEFQQGAALPMVLGALRIKTAPAMIEFFSWYCRRYLDDLYHLEMLFDRISLEGTTTTRDRNPPTMVKINETEYTAHPTDLVFGGWINLDDSDQYFSCILESHWDDFRVKKGRSGFVVGQPRGEDGRIPTRLTVPSGHCLVFYQRLMHEVFPYRQPKNSYRQFRCWRLVRMEIATDSHSLFDDVKDVLEQQGIPKLPSGQRPPMYSANHASCFLFTGHPKKDPIAFSTELLQPKVCQSVHHGNESYHVIPHSMSSLKEMNLPLYPVYPSWEEDYFSPQREFQVPDLDKRGVRAITDWLFPRKPQLLCRL